MQLCSRAPGGKIQRNERASKLGGLSGLERHRRTSQGPWGQSRRLVPHGSRHIPPTADFKDGATKHSASERPKSQNRSLSPERFKNARSGSRTSGGTDRLSQIRDRP